MSEGRRGEGVRKGRGSALNPVGRYESEGREAVDDGWGPPDEADEPRRMATEVREVTPKSVLSRNESPDIPFDRSINPYLGCEHGCAYCYARPAHAYLGLSPGLDFETKLTAKVGADVVLAQELARTGYRPAPVALGANTDPYQPVERRLELTRSILRVLVEARHPLTIVTKNALVERDIDLLQELAPLGGVRVFLSVTTLDHDLARRLEPRASAPARRLRAIETLREAGIPAGVMFAPVIPALNDHELERVLAAAATAGASHAGYVLLRLPHEVKAIFRQWLDDHVPERAEHVMSVVQSLRGGKDNDPRFATRLVGEGPFAELLKQRFAVTLRRHGLKPEGDPLSADAFRPPAPGGQQSLF